MDEQTGPEGPRGPVDPGEPPSRPGGRRRPGRRDGGDLKDTGRLAAEKEAAQREAPVTRSAEGRSADRDAVAGQAAVGRPAGEIEDAGTNGPWMEPDRPVSERPWNERLPQSIKVTPGGGPPGTNASSASGGSGFSGGWGGIVLAAVAASLLTALVVLLALPAIFGVNPYDLVRGELRKSGEGDRSRSVEVAAPVDPTDIAATASDVIPSVVNVSVTNPGGRSPGSGIIYKADGHIITSNAVIAGATGITVTLADGESLQANLVGTDPRTDVAVLKINRKGLPPLVMGDSADLAAGRQVVSVCSPSGLRQEVASGIVSDLHRNVTKPGTQETLTDLIQVDIPVNTGGSGGALCDTMATLVGMNTVAGDQGGGTGMGFAVPVSTVKAVAGDIIAGRPVDHPSIGVFGRSVDETLAIDYQLSVARGALVTSVVPGSPADGLGIRPGDVIIRAAEKNVKSMDDLNAALRAHDIGETIVITYYQDKNLKTSKLKIAPQ